MTNSTPAGTEAERYASPPHSRASRESLEELGVSAEQGLDAAEAKKRLEEAGPNALVRDSRGGIPRIFWRQINDPLMYVLLGSGTLAVLLGKGADSIVVFAVVVLNAIIGFVQEYRATRAIDFRGRLRRSRGDEGRGPGWHGALLGGLIYRRSSA